MGQRWTNAAARAAYRDGFERKVLGAFAAAIAVVSILITINWESSRSADRDMRRVSQTHEVLHQLAHAYATTLQVELSTQAYRLTGDESQIAERDKALAEREVSFTRIRELVNDNPAQVARWEQLRAVTDQRMEISREVERLRRTQGADAANAYITTAPLQATRERSRQIMANMEAQEERLLRERRLIEAVSSQRDTVIGAAVAVALFALLIASYLVIRGQVRANAASHLALRQGEAHLATVLNSIGDAVLVTDADQKVVALNPVAEVLTGWPVAAARGIAVDIVFDVLNEHTRKAVTLPTAEVLRTGQVQALEQNTLLVSRGGAETAISDSAAPILDREGEVVGVVLVFRDVTSERRAQRIIREQNEVLAERVREQTLQLRESQEHLLSVIGSVPAMIAYVDAHQRYVYVNEQYRARFAPDRAGLEGCTVREILGPERYASLSPLIRNALTGLPQKYDWEPFPGVWHAINYMPRFDDAGRVVGYYILSSDITERQQAQERIVGLNRELETRVDELEHVSRALRTLSAGNSAMLRATDESQLLDSMCKAMVSAGGYPLASVWYRVDDEERTLLPVAESGYSGSLGALLRLNVQWADNERGQGAIAVAARTGSMCVVGNLHEHPGYELWREALGPYRSCIACPLHIDGKVMGALAIFSAEQDAFGRDETRLLCDSAADLAFGIATLRAREQQRQVQDEMYQLTHYDVLTGLPNENFFAEALDREIEAARAAGTPFALLQFNIERLREINDGLGFDHGDQIIRDVGLRLRAVLPRPGILARLRGDEFAFLLPEAGLPGAVEAALHIERTMAEPFAIEDLPLHVSMRAGLVTYPAHGETVHDLMRHLDIALNQAKMAKVAHRVFDMEKTPDSRGQLKMAGELRHAIAHGDLRLYVQPKVDMATGHVRGVEALVRWAHPVRGLVPPGDFLPLAERTGLMRPLTQWVMQAALRLGTAWKAAGSVVPIAINISASDLRDDVLVSDVRRLLARDGEAAGILEMELTESTVMEDAAFALRVLHELRDAGIALYIDDFGTGYSSLSYLQKLPVQYIKIDQSFVREMGRSADATAIVRSTIDLAHDLGRIVVAEGIETQEDFQRLAELGCDVAQGYLIARPMPAEAFPAWLAGRRHAGTGPADGP